LPGKAGWWGRFLSFSLFLDAAMDCDTAYLIGALADGGCYHLRYRGGRSEYRCVWTQRDVEWLGRSIIPRIDKILEKQRFKATVRLYRGSTRYEVRVSSKEFYIYITGSMKNIRRLVHECNTVIIRSWLRGLYDAEGDKAGDRIRLWNKDRGVINDVLKALECLNIDVLEPYIDDKRHHVYVVEIPAHAQLKFLEEIRPEHPRLRYNSPTTRPRKFRRA
jgi:hypothetical protein